MESEFLVRVSRVLTLLLWDAQESQRNQELREEIGTQVLITEIDREVEQTPKK